MAVRKPVKLKWAGVEYSTLVTMAVIERVDRELNILSLAQMATPELVQITKVSRLIHILLTEGGAQLTAEDVYESLNDENLIQKDVFYTILGDVMPLLLPKFNGVAKKKPARKKRAAKKE